ncbi:MAG: UDP-N-acetylmuramoyl-L-alanyl-D-glutamate--2,6-diaminopimelate ligase, partial [Acidimicrobiales bacterium]
PRPAREWQPTPVGLSDLARAVPGATLVGDAEVRAVAYDSRRVVDGTLFFAMEGTRTDGHEHADDAVASGASGLVVERRLDLPVPQLVVPSVRHAIGPLSARFYGDPAAQMLTVAVTGTNGKTTTSSVLRQCLDAAGVPAGQVGTVGSRFLDRFVPTSLTTPYAPELHSTLREMVHAGVRAVAVEASSHGLDQGRLDGIAFDVGIFTNLTREHLDYHGTMERYWLAKAALFRPGRCRMAFIGVDDSWGRRLAERVDIPVVTFGASDDADVHVDVTGHDLEGLSVTLRAADGDVTLRTRLVGEVNSANVTAAYLAARHLGVSRSAAVEGIAVAAPPPGRFQLIDAGQPFLVVVDYAHTPDALAALLRTARKIAKGRISVVLGARGGRDKGKRPMTGQIAAQADAVYLTTDSPGDEPISQIIRSLYQGTLDARRNTKVVVDPDRRSAIARAVGAAREGDAVLIVGRGHEQFQHIGDETVPLDDRVAAHDAIMAACPKTGPDRCD